MAYEPVTIEQLEELAERFRRCARIISTVISDLRARQVNETQAQIVTLNKHVLPRAEDLIEKLEADTTVHPKQAEKSGKNARDRMEWIKATDKLLEDIESKGALTYRIVAKDGNKDVVIGQSK